MWGLVGWNRSLWRWLWRLYLVSVFHISWSLSGSKLTKGKQLSSLIVFHQDVCLIKGFEVRESWAQIILYVNFTRYLVTAEKQTTTKQNPNRENEYMYNTKIATLLFSLFLIHFNLSHIDSLTFAIHLLFTIYRNFDICLILELMA